MKRSLKKRNPEAGFALLFVYAMAATVAIMLLMELPSAAFEAQRDREQLLIDRGEQYSRGIQLYVRKFNRYPPDFDALDNTQNQRFLRHRYEDPLTGKEEWRIIHVGPGGVFTDSLLYNKKKDANAPAEKQTFITELPMVTDPNTGTAGVNIATRRGAGQGAPNPNDPNAPFPGAPVSVLPGQQFPGQNLPGQPFPGGGFPGQVLPGQSGQLTDPNQPQQTLPGGLPPGVQLPPGTQLPPGIQLPGQIPGTGPGGAATNLINQLLTTPRPGGLGGLATTGTQQTTVDAFGNPVPQQGAPGTISGFQPPGQPIAAGQPGAGQQPAAAAQTIGGGIAGVASKVEQEGIKRYRERKLYNEWEFVYDITKDTGRAGGAGQQAGAGAAAQGSAAPTQSVFGQNPVPGAQPTPPPPPPPSLPTMPPGPPAAPQQ